MVTTDSVDAIAALLGEAEAAHGVYETTQLDGVYDARWPAWYAAYAVDHGLAGILGHAVTAEDLAAFLTRSWQEFEAADPKPAEPWATATARRIATEF
jgi:hypothetical protein